MIYSDSMSKNPTFATAGSEAEKIDVRLSYRIVRLFSEGLYASPNKAIEEMVTNSFDAGARVHDEATRDVLWCGFSRLIITKSAGASLAMDLSHSRPHKEFTRAPVMIGARGRLGSLRQYDVV
jgi:hypothetical protein